MQLLHTPRCFNKCFDQYLHIFAVSAFRSASASVSAECVAAESATAAEQENDPEAAVIAASVSAECAAAASATAAKQKDNPQAGRHSVSVVASTSTVCSS